MLKMETAQQHAFIYFVPVEGILYETLFPNHGCDSPGHEVGIILGPIAHKMVES